MSMAFSRQKYWGSLPFSPPGDLPNRRVEPTSLLSPAAAGRFFTTELPEKPIYWALHTYLVLGTLKSPVFRHIRLRPELVCGDLTMERIRVTACSSLRNPLLWLWFPELDCLAVRYSLQVMSLPGLVDWIQGLCQLRHMRASLRELGDTCM